MVAKSEIWQAAKPIAELKARLSAQSTAIDAAIAATGCKPETLVYLPMVGRRSFWTVLIDVNTAEVIGFVPIDSF